MRRDRRLLATLAASAAAAAALLALFAAAAAALVGSTLSDEERAALSAALSPRTPLLLIVALAVVGLAAAAAQPLYRRWIAPPARLLEQARVLAATDTQRELQFDAASADLRGLAQLIGELAAQRDGLKRDIAEQVALASRGIEQERNRLAALMSELTQSVVVCNLDGRILLYNNRARLQFRALSDAPSLAGGSELIGLGRSIYAVFDRRLAAHALDSACSSGCSAARPTRARSSSPPRAQRPAAAARRWRRCAAWPATARPRRRRSAASC